MTTVASRELRNQTRALLERAAGGERITITVNGRPVAVLGPTGRRPTWMSREAFVHTVLANRADPGLRRELADLAPDRTDDLAP